MIPLAHLHVRRLSTATVQHAVASRSSASVKQWHCSVLSRSLEGHLIREGKCEPPGLPIDKRSVCLSVCFIFVWVHF
jgi:hypothetical protein